MFGIIGRGLGRVNRGPFQIKEYVKIRDTKFTGMIIGIKNMNDQPTKYQVLFIDKGERKEVWFKKEHLMR